MNLNDTSITYIPSKKSAKTVSSIQKAKGAVARTARIVKTNVPFLTVKQLRDEAERAIAADAIRRA